MYKIMLTMKFRLNTFYLKRGVLTMEGWHIPSCSPITHLCVLWISYDYYFHWYTVEIINTKPSYQFFIYYLPTLQKFVITDCNDFDPRISLMILFAQLLYSDRQPPYQMEILSTPLLLTDLKLVKWVGLVMWNRLI